MSTLYRQSKSISGLYVSLESFFFFFELLLNHKEGGGGYMIMAYAVVLSQCFCSLLFHLLPLPVLCLRLTSFQTSISLKFHLFAKIDILSLKAIIPDLLNKLVVIS
jgi:hypothetical protein